MTKFLTTTIGRFRLLAFLEGISLLVLVFVAVPMKYGYNNHSLSKSLGPVHGALFILFVINAITIGNEQNWKFTQTTWKVMLASFIPFGTFYVDYKILRPFQEKMCKEKVKS